MRRALVFVSIAAALGAGACRYESAFERSNPFDPESSVQLSLGGPDSTYSIGEEIQFDIISSEPMPPGPLLIGWQSSNPQILVAAAEGRYVVGVGASAQYVDITVTARLANRSVFGVVRVGQLADSMRLVCTPTA